MEETYGVPNVYISDLERLAQKTRKSALSVLLLAYFPQVGKIFKKK